MLTEAQIKELIDTHPHRRELDRARIHQSRLKFHTDTEILKTELSEYHNEFIAWICAEQPELLPKDKVERFKQLMTCPLPTVQLTESIGMALSRVFDGQDAFNRYDFNNPENEKDWEKYRDDEFWHTEGFQAMINAIDSVWVVDLADKGDKPEPKNQLINIENVLDISCKRDGECLYVIFKVGDVILAYDDYSIRKFENKEGNIGDLIVEFVHGMGYCPARMFWSEFLKSDNVINHKAPLTNVLSELDWLLVHKIFKKYMDIANSWPILVTYRSGDNFEDFKREENKGRSEAGQKTKGNKLIGPGSQITVPVPMEGQPDLMTNPLAWITPDIESLQFHVTEDERLTDYIYRTSVGIDGEQNNDQAKNEKQVLASFENQSTIIQRVAGNFEKIQSFADKVIIFLRYGEDIEPSIDYGSKWFLKTAEDLAEEKESVKGDEIITDAINAEMIETKFRNDSGGKIRAQVLNDLDPLPGKEIDEAIKIKNAGGIDDKSFKIKANFMRFVRRFEREQLPIDQFMKYGDYNERVKLINQQFEKYAGEFKTDSNDRGGESGLLPRNGGEGDPESEGPKTSDSEEKTIGIPAS